MGRRFDEMLLAELLIERTLPLVKQAQSMKAAGTKGHNLGQWERLLRDLTQTDPSELFQGYKDDDIFKQITGIQNYQRNTVIGSSNKSKITQAQMDRHRQIFGFDTHHMFGLDENQMITMLMTKPSDMANVSAVRRANDRQAYFDTQGKLGRKSGSDKDSFVSEPQATHKGNAVEGSNTDNPSLSQASSYHEGSPKATPFRYEVGMGDPEAAAMEFYQNQEPTAARNAELMDPTNPTHGNRLRELRAQTLSEAENPAKVSQLWKKGKFDELEEMFPDKGIKALYDEAQGVTKNPNDRLVQPGEVVNPRAAQAELAGIPNPTPGRVGAARALGKLKKGAGKVVPYAGLGIGLWGAGQQAIAGETDEALGTAVDTVLQEAPVVGEALRSEPVSDGSLEGGSNYMKRVADYYAEKQGRIQSKVESHLGRRNTLGALRAAKEMGGSTLVGSTPGSWQDNMFNGEASEKDEKTP